MLYNWFFTAVHMVLCSQKHESCFLWPNDLGNWPMTLTFIQDLCMIDLYQHTEFCVCRPNGLSVRVPTISMVLNDFIDLVASSFDVWPWPSNSTYIQSILIIVPNFMTVRLIVQLWGCLKCEVLVCWCTEKCTSLWLEQN